MRRRTCRGGVGSGVVDGSASRAGREDIAAALTAGPEGHKGPVDTKGGCGDVGGRQRRCS